MDRSIRKKIINSSSYGLQRKNRSYVRIIIATDADSAGQAMAEEIARRIGKDRCFKIEFPEGCKDANDVLVKLGKDAQIKL